MGTGVCEVLPTGVVGVIGTADPIWGASLLALPRLRGRFVPGGASKFTVQYEPKPGSVAGRGWRSNRRLRER